MRKLTGKVRAGWGVASPNLNLILGLLQERTGFPSLITGTLNIEMDTHFPVTHDAFIEREEYNNSEYIKLQRCRVQGRRAFIMRPEWHEQEVEGPRWRFLELMSDIHLRTCLALTTGDLIEVEVEGDEEWWTEPKGPE